LIDREHVGYDVARRVWNGNVDRRPALVVRCTGVADVQCAVNFARVHGIRVSVRGGGHSAPGYGTNDGGLVIDMSPMKGIRVDPMTGTARAEGRVLWRELDRETQVFGLATTGGTVSNTGIAGLTLGGGLGWLMGKHGLTVDNLISADVITADGTFRHVSATNGDYSGVFRRELRSAAADKGYLRPDQPFPYQREHLARLSLAFDVTK
jgi:FAD/FMN-containing dehydrogenase